MLSTDGTVLTLAATDLEVWLVTTCACVPTLGGAVTVSAQKLHEMARSLPSGSDIRISTDGTKTGVKIDCGSFKARLQAMPVEEFPIRPAMPEAWTDLPRDVVRAMVLRTRYAIKEDQKFFMDGVLLRTEAAKMTMVGTDGHRMSIATAERKGDAQPDAILPRRTMESLLPTLDAEADSVQFSVGQNHLFFKVGARNLVSRVVDGKFPAWERIVKAPADIIASVPRDAFLGALRRTAMVSDKQAIGAKLTLSKGQLRLSASSVTIGDADETLEVAYEGPDMEASVNIGYAIDIASVAEAGHLGLEITGGSKPVVIYEAAEKHACTGIIMPMRA
jgi:DNA polymerase-3 subunit beta